MSCLQSVNERRTRRQLSIDSLVELRKIAEQVLAAAAA